MAEEAESCGAILDPDVFHSPGRMPEQIAAYCRKTGQPVPAEPGAMCRTILESLAATYRTVLEKLETVTDHRIERIHIVGGGSQNTLLNRLAAQATGRTVIAGPVEATAAGNILVQAIGAGVVSSLDEARAIVRRSFQVAQVS
jgi:rhamnulokinase